MEYVLSVIYLVLILVFIKKSSFFISTNLKSNTLFFLFFIKLFAAYCLFLIYSKYYTDRSTADIFKYFDDSTWLYKNVFTKSPVNYLKIIVGIHTDQPYIHYELKQTQYWFKPHETNVFNDNRTVIRFNLIIYLFSLGYYHIHTLILCFLSFIGLTAIYKTFNKLFPSKSLILIFAIFLMPSVLIWGSGILKESILLFSIGIFVFYLSEYLFFTKRNLITIVWILISFLLLTITKPYVIITLIPSTIGLISCQKIKKLNPTLFFVIINVLVISIGIIIDHYSSTFNILGNLVYKQHDFLNVARDTHAKSTIYVEHLSNDLYSFIHFSPSALFNGLLRPTIFELKSLYYFLPSIESLILIICVVFIIIRPSKLENENQLLLINFSIFFTLFLSLLIGLVVPVLGAIVRYRVPYLPFLYSALFMKIKIPKSSFINKIELLICK